MTRFIPSGCGAEHLPRPVHLLNTSMMFGSGATVGVVELVPRAQQADQDGCIPIEKPGILTNLRPGRIESRGDPRCLPGGI